MRRKAKVDDNQSEIVDALRAIGCSVAITSGAGDGFTDLVVGRMGVNFLLEVKDGAKFKSKQKLTPDQVIFHDNWRGQVAVVTSAQEALDVVTRG